MEGLRNVEVSLGRDCASWQLIRKWHLRAQWQLWMGLRSWCLVWVCSFKSTCWNLAPSATVFANWGLHLDEWLIHIYLDIYNENFFWGLFILCVWVLYLHVWVSHMYLAVWEIRRGCPIPWNLNDRWSWTTMLVPGLNLSPLEELHMILSIKLSLQLQFYTMSCMFSLAFLFLLWKKTFINCGSWILDYSVCKL